MRGTSRTNTDSTFVPQPALVPAVVESNQWTELRATQNTQSTVPARDNEAAPAYNNDGGISLIGKCLTNAGISKQTADIIMQSWRPTTAKQYGSYLKRWMLFCDKKQIDQLNPSIGEILSFLTQLQDDGLGYSAINTAKSMLSTMFRIIHSRDIGNEILVKRFMIGVFHLKPSLLKTAFTWDVKVVLKFLNTMENHELNLRMLSVKLAVLIALTTGQRCQTLKDLTIRNIELNCEYMKIRIGELLKQSRPRKHLSEIYIEKFKANPNVCVLNVLIVYLKKTEQLCS